MRRLYASNMHIRFVREPELVPSKGLTLPCWHDPRQTSAFGLALISVW